MNKMVNKLLAGMLVITLTFANLILLGTYATESFALSTELENQATRIKDKVDFDVYFLDGKGEKTHTNTIDMDSQDGKIYMAIKVLEGYLRNAKVELTDTNFQLVDVSSNYEVIQSMSDKEIVLNQVGNGQEIVLEIPITVKNTDTISLNDFTKENQIKISGSAIGNNGRTVSIENTIKAKLNLHGNATPVVEQKVTKFTPYHIGDSRGFMLQQTVNTGLENHTLPIEETSLEVVVPTLEDGTKPDQVMVSSTSLVATKNDKEATTFTTENWNYDAEKGIVSISVENERNNQNSVTWGKDGFDEFEITYIFENKVMPEKLELNLTSNVTIKAYNNEQTEVQKLETTPVVLEEKIGDIATFEIASTDTLGKGYMYANSEYETEYQTTWTVDLGYADLVDQITMNQTEDVFVDQNGKTYTTGANDTYYKTTKMAKDNFTKILGSEESSSLTIYDRVSGEVIATITSATPADEDGNIVINYAKETGTIKIETSKPVHEGKLEMNHTKAIKAQTGYTVEQLKSFVSLKTEFVGKILSADTKIVEEQKTKEISLTEPTTKIDAFVNNAKDINLSTVVENENVEFRVVLENTDITTDLFKNPTVEVVFPDYIDEMVVNNISVLYDDELTINKEGITTFTTENGRAAIKIPLLGTQTTYNSNKTQNGTNLVINADIKAKELTPSVNTEIETFVTNENATGYEQEKEGKAYQLLGANFVAPTGMVTINSISNYNNKQEEVTSSNGTEEVGKIAVLTEAKTAKVTAKVINNYEETCKNISVLGRIPFAGNKSLASGEDLGSTFTAKMVSAITAETGITSDNMTVYYSQNENATNVVTDQANGWTTDVVNLENVKSYLIVCNNYEMAKGDSFVFSYQVEIPANLKHNESAFGMYAVIFNKDSGTDKMIAPKVGISTMEGITLDTKLSNDIEENAAVQEGQIIKYTVTVTNTGNVVADNLTVTSAIPEGTVAVRYIPENTGENGEPEYGPARYVEKPEQTTFTGSIDRLQPGETKTVSYEVKVLPGAVGVVASTSATVTSAEYTEDVYTTNTLANTIEKGYFTMTLRTSLTETTNIGQDQKMFYEITLANATSETKNNVQVTMNLPEEVTYGVTYLYDNQEGDYNQNASIAQYNEQDRTLTITIPTLEDDEVKVAIGVTTNKLSDNDTRKDVNMTVEATCDGMTNTIKSNNVSFSIVKAKLSITQTSDIAEGTIAEGESLTYIIDITNIGEATANNIMFADQLPDGVVCKKVEYTLGNSTSTDTSNMQGINRFFSLDPNEKMTIKITVETDTLGSNIREKEIKNIASISSTEIATLESNSITHTIDSSATPSNPNNPSDPTTKYKISGAVWVDANEDGSKDDTEGKLDGVEVVLVDVNNNTVVNRTTTDSFGKYTFTDLERGKYMVAFLYDSVIYTVTEYHKDGVNESRNSDAIANSITVDNQALIGALTDNIEVSNSSVNNIDLGLVARNKFDLSLTKSISNITVKTTKGTQNYNYNDGTTLAKVDIAPKRIDGANVVITYKFIVRNEGNIAGCANKIVDYLPSELKFSTNMNPDWYQGDNGAIYNASLSNDMIQPGETREITLTLTKTMTGESTGIVNNTAEIYEAYNDLGLADINSTPANKAQSENDLGSADVLLTVNTGEPAMYITITVIMLAMVAVGVYMIDKKVLKKTM